MDFTPYHFSSTVSRIDLKYRARLALSGRWNAAVLVMLLYLLLSLACGSIPLVGSIILLPPLVLGLNIFFLRFYRYGENQFDNMFKGFDMFGKALGVFWLTRLYVFLWSLLFIIPGTIASYSYSQAMLIIYDHPEITVSEALRRSKAMMYGNKLTLFIQDLSFLGWFLLSVFPGFYIGFLWSMPYYHVTRIAFYDNLLESAGMTY